MEKQKNIEQDILQRPSLKENPYTLPQGYFAMVEDSVRKRIHNEEEYESGKRWITILKPAVMLAMTFGAIFGLGYGAMYVTGTTQQESNSNFIVKDEPAEHPATTFDTETLFETMRSTALLEALIEPSNDETPASTGNYECHKDNIEQYLIESNVSLITLASLE